MFKFSKAWWCCLSDKSNQVPLTYCRILFYTRQLKFPLHIYLVLFFRFAHCSVGSPLTISNLQKRKINSSQSTNICVTALLEYQTKLLSPSMLLLLLIFMLWLLFFLSMSMYMTLSLDHTSKWIGSFVLCYFLLSIQASFIAYSTIKQ